MLFKEELRGHEVNIRVSKDMLLATMSVDINLETQGVIGDFPTYEELKNMLMEYNINYGILEDNIKGIIRDKITNYDVKVAMGTKSIAGEAAKIEYTYDLTNMSKLEEDDKGVIDYKNLKWFVQVKEGDILAEKILAKEGIAGKDIRGKDIEPIRGKDVQLKEGKNVGISEDGMYLKALTNGRLESEKGILKINEVLEIAGDVDMRTGNISYTNDVIVKGDVKAGFVVECGGSLEVGGIIEAATIKVGKDLVVKSGVRGSLQEGQINIEVGGNLICKFIENARVNVKGNIQTDFILQSDINCSKSVIVKGKKGLIVGGIVRSKDEVSCKVLGSAMGIKTNIELGVSLEDMVKIREYKNMQQERIQKINILKPKVDTGKVKLQKGILNNVGKQVFIKVLEEYNLILQEINSIDLKVQELEKGSIDVNGVLRVNEKINAGVRVAIGTKTKHFKDISSGGILNVQDNEVVLKR